MRYPGYYWVKLEDTNIYQLAEFTPSKDWLLIGTSEVYDDDNFLFISSSPILKPCNECGAIGFPQDSSTRASGETYQGCTFCTGKY